MIFFGLPDDVGVEASRSDGGGDGLCVHVNAAIPPARCSLRGECGQPTLLLLPLLLRRSSESLAPSREGEPACSSIIRAGG